MTDSEKIAKIVAWMGGWPEHQILHVGTWEGDLPACYRCRTGIGRKSGTAGYIPPICEAFNPFKRIEDAFLVVERLLAVGKYLVFLSFCNEAYFYGHKGGSSDTPARAIAEAAFQVIEKLSGGKP